jgi:hypothetical protein
VYYIRIPPELEDIKHRDIVLVKLHIGSYIYPMVRVVARISNYKIVTLPNKMKGIWSILNKRKLKVTVEIEKITSAEELESIKHRVAVAVIEAFKSGKTEVDMAIQRYLSKLSQ